MYGIYKKYTNMKVLGGWGEGERRNGWAELVEGEKGRGRGVEGVTEEGRMGRGSGGGGGVEIP